MKQYRSAKAGREIRRTYDALLAQWPTDVTEMNIETRYGLTHVLAAGRADAAPLLLFHGVGDDAALMWIYNAGALAEHFRLYAVDTLGGPGKSPLDGRYNQHFDDVLWIDDLLAGLRLETCALAGVSHGGYLVQLYTLMRGERVEKAVAISSAVPSGEKSASPMKTMMKIFLPEALLPTPRNVERLLRKLSGAHPEVFLSHPALMEHYRWLLKGFNNMAMGYHQVRSFTPEEIEAIRGRVLYLVGEADPFQRLGGKEALLTHGMNTVFYPDAGHGLNHELAEEINRKLISHLLSQDEEEENSHGL